MDWTEDTQIQLTHFLALCIVKFSHTGRFHSNRFRRLRHVSRPKYKLRLLTLARAAEGSLDD